MTRKGQDNATSVMTFIILVALFMVLYVLLLPPEDRANLLNGENSTKNTDNTGGSAAARMLLLESPGDVLPSQDNKITHDIDSVNLFVRTIPVITTLSSSITVSRSAFGRSDQTLVFDLEQLNNLKTASLSFFVDKPQGTLIIELNGNTVYKNRLNDPQPVIITLPSTSLRERNDLKIYTDSPGILFFRTNQYILKDIKLKQEFQNINSKESRTFSISPLEKEAIDSSRLDFFVFCNSLSGDYTTFKADLNNKQLFSEILTCSGGERGVDIDPNLLIEGKNELLFVIEGGDFTVSNIELQNKLNTALFRSYAFDITKNEFDKIKGEDSRVFLRLAMTQKGTSKKATVWINDQKVTIDTTSDTFARDISDLILRGENIVKIVPVNEFTIVTLKVTLE